MPERTKNIGLIALCVVIMLVSVLGVAPKMEKLETYSGTVETLDMLKENAALMTGTAAVAATAAAAIPGDATTPVANKIADVAGYMVIVYAAIVIEKYFVVTIGGITCRWIIPAVCLIMIAYLAARVLGRSGSGIRWLKELSVRICAAALILWMVVPVSAGMSQTVYDIYNTTSEKRLEELDKKYEDAGKISDESTEDSEEKKGVLDGLLGSLKDSADAVKDSLSAATEKSVDYFKAKLDILVEGAGVLVAITVVIPAAMLIFGLWVIKLLFNLNINIGIGALKK